MKVSTNGNDTVLMLHDGSDLFLHYGTPVAAHIPGRGFIRTAKKWSVTTSRHINEWAGFKVKDSEPQEFFTNMLKLL
jgi:hypothetical protein